MLKNMIDENNNLKKKIEGDELCFTTEGKYIIDGKEISIDYNDEQIPLDLLKKLEASTMNQLDAFYIRKNIHRIAKVFDKLSTQIDDRIIEVEKRIYNTEMEFEKFAAHEIICQMDKVPEIASKVVHSIVNGKFDRIATALDTISTSQEIAKKELVEYKTAAQEKHLEIMSAIQYTSDRTIFGWLKNQYVSKPLRTLLIGGLASIILFLYIMTTLNIHSFDQMVEFIIGWFK